MKRAVPFILDTLHALAMALWLGGLVALFVAIESGIPDKVIGKYLWRASIVFELCGLVMLGVQFLLRRRYQHVRPLFIADGVRQLLTFAALFLAEFARSSLVPALGMESPSSNQALSRYFGLAILQIALLTGVTTLTTWLQRPQAQAAPTAVTPPVAAPSPPPRPSIRRRPAK